MMNENTGFDLQTTEDFVADELKNLGIPCNLIGYRYLRRAVALCIQDPDAIKHIVKGLYANVAEQYGTTVSRTERAIRHCVAVCFDRSDPDTIEAYFGRTVSARKGHATNAEFIAMVAENVRRKMREYYYVR